MDEQVKLNELENALAELDYPLSRQEVIDQCGDVRIELADGSENLAELVAGSNDDSFGSVDGLASEVRNLLPQRAVGEPHQSEGEG